MFVQLIAIIKHMYKYSGNELIIDLLYNYICNN